MSGVASWAVFLDNATMLETVHEYFKSGQGNGRLAHYIIDAEGECQESGRDQVRSAARARAPTPTHVHGRIRTNCSQASDTQPSVCLC